MNAVAVGLGLLEVRHQMKRKKAVELGLPADAPQEDVNKAVADEQKLTKAQRLRDNAQILRTQAAENVARGVWTDEFAATMIAQAERMEAQADQLEDLS